MRSTRSVWTLSLVVAILAVAVPADDAAAQVRTRPSPTVPSLGRATPAPAAPTPAAPAPEKPAPAAPTPVRAAPAPIGLPTRVADRPAVKAFTLPNVSYGAPVAQPPGAARSLNAPLPRFENFSIPATVGGRSTSRPMVMLNGRDGIENAPGIPDGARRLLAMHVRKLAPKQSTVYLFDPQLAEQWRATHDVPPEIKPEEEHSNCGEISVNGFVDCGEDLRDATAAEYERARRRADDSWKRAVGELEDQWNEAQDCFADHILPGGSVPLRFDETPTMTLNLQQSGSRGSGSVSGSAEIGVPMKGDLRAKVDLFYIPCLPFVVRPRSLSVEGSMIVGEQLDIDAVASGAFSKTYTIPPTGGPRFPIYVIPIVIGDVPVAVLDLSAYVEGTVDLSATGSVSGQLALRTEHQSEFNFTCNGSGCRPESRDPKASNPTTTSESAQIDGVVSAKPGIYTALQLTLNYNVLGARLGPLPYMLGKAMGCGAASATQTAGGASTGEQSAALIADVDWGVDFRAEALAGGVVVGNDYRKEIISPPRHVWFKDLAPGGSSGMRAAITGATEAVAGEPSVYKLRMPACYPYEEIVEYRVAWTGSAAPSAVPSTACQFTNGTGSCRFDPQSELELRFMWPAAGSYSVSAAAISDPHQRFDPPYPPTNVGVTVASSGGS